MRVQVGIENNHDDRTIAWALEYPGCFAYGAAAEAALNLHAAAASYAARVRVHLVSLLPTLVGVAQVIELDGELWSPRKLLRRTLWHEREHTVHIQRLL
jgi:hypothetical protein